MNLDTLSNLSDAQIFKQIIEAETAEQIVQNPKNIKHLKRTRDSVLNRSKVYFDSSGTLYPGYRFLLSIMGHDF